MTDEELKLLQDQAEKIEEDCDRASVRDSLVSAYWYGRNLWLGGLAAGFAAVSAFTAAQNGAGSTGDIFGVPLAPLASVTAFLSAILGATLTFLAPSQKAESFHKFSNTYWALRDRIRAFKALECLPGADWAPMKKKFDDILAEKQKVDTDHPVVPERYYQKAVKVITQRIVRNRDLKELRKNPEKAGKLSASKKLREAWWPGFANVLAGRRDEDLQRP